MFGSPPSQPQAPTVKIPDPPPPQSMPGTKPGKKQQPNPTIIGASNIPTAPQTLMGPGSLGSALAGNKFLG